MGAANEADGSVASRVVEPLLGYLHRMKKILADQAYKKTFMQWVENTIIGLEVEISSAPESKKVSVRANTSMSFSDILVIAGEVFGCCDLGFSPGSAVATPWGLCSASCNFPGKNRSWLHFVLPYGNLQRDNSFFPVPVA